MNLSYEHLQKKFGVHENFIKFRGGNVILRMLLIVSESMHKSQCKDNKRVGRFVCA